MRTEKGAEGNGRENGRVGSVNTVKALQKMSVPLEEENGSAKGKKEERGASRGRKC